MIAVSWGFVVAGLVPAILVHDVVVGLAGFTVALFFLGVAIAPLWTATMDIAPNYAGSSSALMNAAGAVAGILSPVAFGWLLDRTGSWTTPFALLSRALAVRHRHDLVDPAGPPDRGCSQPRPLGGSRGVDHPQRLEEALDVGRLERAVAVLPPASWVPSASACLRCRNSRNRRHAWSPAPVIAAGRTMLPVAEATPRDGC
jgi:MFS family permease